MPVTRYLVTDATAAEVKRLTGLEGHDTPLGVLVEKPKSFYLDVAMERLERQLHPRCCRGVILHEPNCPSWGVVT